MALSQIRRNTAADRQSWLSSMFIASLFTLRASRWTGFVLAAIAFLAPPASAEKPAAFDDVAWSAYGQETPGDFTQEIPGARSPEVAVEVYLPPAIRRAPEKGWPVLLLVHGGGWNGGSRDLLAPHARYFAALGWACVNVSYRLNRSSDVTIAGQQQDVREALDWVRAEAPRRGWDAARIDALGESAGGQLVCALGVLPPEPSRWRAHRLVLVNPVLDLVPLPWTRDQPGLKEAGPFDPAAPGQHPAWLSSPLHQLAAGAPEILVLHGRDDATVPFAQAEALGQRGRQVGVPVEVVGLPNTAHAFLLSHYGKPETIRASLRRIADFLRAP